MDASALWCDTTSRNESNIIEYMEQIYKPMDDYRVFVRCNTFNQSKYIEDALNGFAMQQTNFSFVCLVMDDFSTDGEQDVIKAWMERECDMSRAEHFETELSNIIIVSHKSNTNCNFAFYLLKRNTWKEKALKVAMYAPWREHCEYEALCEGDDYWTDNMKLQKQVDFLTKHSAYSLCFHNAVVTWEDKSHSDSVFAKVESKEYKPSELISSWIIPTASMLMRIKCTSVSKELQINNEKIIYGDSLLKLCCLHEGKVFGFADTMSVYRKQLGGAVYNRSIEQFYRFITQLDYCRCVFPEFRRDLRKCLSDAEFDLFLQLISRSRYSESFSWYVKSLLHSPIAFVVKNLSYIKQKMF